jgi:hypothetical protein
VKEWNRERPGLACGPSFFGGTGGANLWLVCGLRNLGPDACGWVLSLLRMFCLGRPFCFRLRSLDHLGLWISCRRVPPDGAGIVYLGERQDSWIRVHYEDTEGWVNIRFIAKENE